MADSISTAVAQARLLLARATPDAPDQVFAAAVAATRAGIDREALPLLKATIAVHPDDHRLWQMTGLIHRSLDALAPALDALRTAAALAPRDALIAHSLARATLEAGLPASDLFERAHRLAPLDAPVLLGRAAAHYADGHIERAIAQLDEQLGEHPAWDGGHATVSRLRWLGGDRSNFTASYERALAANPKHGLLWRDLALAHLDAGDHAAATSTIARARAAVGASATLDILEASSASESGDVASADGLFAAIPPAARATMAARYVRHLLRAGRPDEAAALAQSRLEEEDGPALWPYLGLAWRLTGDPRAQWLEGDERLIGVHDIGDRVGSLDALANRLRGLHLAAHQPLEQSLRGGTQTDGPLFSRIDPDIRALRTAVLDAVQAYVAQLPPPDPSHPFLGQPRAPLRFAGSWSVRLTDKGFHIAHVHPAGWISSAFYVALPDTVGGPDKAGWLTLGDAPELGIDLPPIRLVEPRPGRLVLFPSIMWHGTRPFDAGERLTVAFDIARLPR